MKSSFVKMSLTAVIANLCDETFIKEHLSLAGKRVALPPA